MTAGVGERSPGSSESTLGRLELACAAAAFAVPFALALPHLDGSPRAENDRTLLRGLAWLGNGLTGGLSALLVQASFAVPLGAPAYRAALVSALMLSAASVAAFLLVRGVLAINASTPRLSCALALIAALTVSTSAAGQREAELAGGAGTALLLALVILLGLGGAVASDDRRAAWLGLLMGALLAEAAPTALVLAVAVVLARRVVRRSNPPPAPASGRAAWATCVGTLALLWSPLAIRRFAVSPFLSLAALSAPLPSPAFALTSAVRILHSELGWFAFALAVLGAVAALLRRRLRAPASCFAIIVAFDALTAWVPLPALGRFAALHLLALSAIATAIAVAVQSASVALAEFRLPLTRGAIVFLVMADLTITVSMAEQGAYAREEEAEGAWEALSDEAIARLPENATVLASTPSLTARLLAARLLENARPDVLPIPLSSALERRFASALLEREPALQQLLRDVVVEGYPREEALTIMTDARPLLCELERAWDRRTVSHLVPEGLWLKFAAQPLGTSDRRAGYGELRSAVDAVLSGRDGEHPDPTTVAILRARLVDAAIVGAALGDRDELPGLLQAIGRITPNDPFVRELSARLAAPKGALDWKTLPR